MKFEFSMAWRYLFSKHRLNFITVISYLSLTGITLGTAALILVLAVFNGFGSLVTSYLVNFDPHIRIDAVTESSLTSMDYLDSLLNKEDLAGYSPFVSGKVLVQQNKITQVVNLKGISPDAAGSVYGIKNSIALGSASMNDNEGLPQCLMGIYLADKLYAMVGDTITLISPSGIERSIVNLSLPKMHKAVISGIYSANNIEYDGSYIFIPLDAAQNVLGYKNRVQGVELRLHSIEDAEAQKEHFQNALGDGYSVTTWYDFHKELYSVMQIERWAAYILLSLIIAVAVFNILGSLSMSVIEKKRDIGILRAMGAAQNSIVKIFIAQGFFIGVIGTLLGFTLGLIVYWLHINYNIYPLDPAAYKINSLPMELKITDFLAVGIAAIGLSVAAAIYPAKKASQLDPIESIKWE